MLKFIIIIIYLLWTFSVSNETRLTDWSSHTVLHPLIFTRPLASRGVSKCLSDCVI